MEKFESFRNVKAGYALPKTMRAVVMEGPGFEKLKIKDVPVPVPGPSQILARVDCTTICTSVLKLVSQGSDHPFLYGWDLAKKPLIPGDEGAVTVVLPGRNVAKKFPVGQRLAIQPAVDSAPINNLEMYRDHGKGIDKVAVGYTLQGNYAEYILLTEETIKAGCLVPVPESLPYFGASLSEPISCVVSAQDHHLHLSQKKVTAQREAVKGIRKGGTVIVAGAGPMGRLHMELAMNYSPALIIALDVDDGRLAWVEKNLAPKAAGRSIKLACVNTVKADAVERVKSLAGLSMGDDVIDATGNPASIKVSQQLVGRGGVLNLFGGIPMGSHILPFDTMVIHYKEINITGSSGGGPVDTINTLDLMARKGIDPGFYVSVVGSLDSAIDFLTLVKERRIEGKAVIYPHIGRMEPSFVDYWSQEKEEALLNEKLR